MVKLSLVSYGDKLIAPGQARYKTHSKLFLSKKVKYLFTIFNKHTHISSVGVDYNCGGNCHQYITFFNKSCSLNRNEPGDAIETTRHSFVDNKKFWT